MLLIKNLCKSFGKTRVLDNINLSLDCGKVHGFIGRNGSGKTVLFKCICGLLPYDCGFIELDGVPVCFSKPQFTKIGALIESPGFLEDRSGYENLKLLGKLSGVNPDAAYFMKCVGLDEARNKKVGHYSLGMKQRLGIAQAIMEQRPYLILDEPMNSLDESAVEIVRNLILTQKAKGVTVLIASHYKEDIEMLCDTVTLLQDGKIWNS
jgi:ABC-2 type transport system ATP-binding protein